MKEQENDLRINNGGAREGAGRKSKFNDPVTYGIRMERETRDKIKSKFGNKTFNKMLRDWIKNLLS